MRSWIKCVIFDLDGVISDSKYIHFVALNRALEEINPTFQVSEEWYESYDGISSSKKLEILTKEKGFPKELHGRILTSKRRHTLDMINFEIEQDNEKSFLFSKLKFYHDVKICVASNSSDVYVNEILTKMQIRQYVDIVVGGDKIKYQKPNAQTYLQIMSDCGVCPTETIIFEDTVVGQKAALDSGAHLVKVKSVDEVNIGNVIREIRNAERNCRFNQFDATILHGLENVNVLVPMAGRGQRFVNSGYTIPKPFIDVRGKSMVQVSIDSVGIPGKYVYCALQEHLVKYQRCFAELLNHGDVTVSIDSVTNGTVSTTLYAENYINNDDPLFIINSDQYIEWDHNRFMTQAIKNQIDGGIVTFKANDDKWSYAKTQNEFSDVVVEVAEKQQISDNATVGIYFWRKGSDYVKYAKQMIQKDIRTNNEFYVCPVYNEAIADGKKIVIFQCDKMLGLGTPEDLTKNVNLL
jgi:beta-phosphoglucomutase-like phosphatase (HAD superfamily)/dTDP-glucose pyrophosphorylase